MVYRTYGTVLTRLDRQREAESEFELSKKLDTVGGASLGGFMLYPVTEVRNFVTGLDHPEGVAVGADGTLFAGGEAGQVYRISADGKKVETLANTGGFCLGITLDRKEDVMFAI